MSTPSDLEQGSINILVAQISDELYQSLCTVIADDQSLKLIGRTIAPLDTLLAAAAAVDIVVLEAQGQPGIVGHLLGEYPELKIVVFQPEGGATIFWRGLRRRDLTAAESVQLHLPLREAYAIEPTS
jgi:hypothetical protein